MANGGVHEPQPAFRHTRTLTGHTRAVANAKFSPAQDSLASGALLATASADSNAMLWDPATGQALRTLEGHSKGISDVAWSPNCQLLCTASDDATLKLWDVETGTCLRTLYGHTNFVFCCSFSPHGHLLASGSFDETMRVWDVRSSTCLREVPAHSDPVTAVHFSWDGTLLVSSSLDGLIRVWDTATSHCLKTLFDTHSAPVSYVRFTPNGRYLLSASLDSRIRLWDYERGKAVKFYSSGHQNSKFCASCTFGSERGAPGVVVRQKRGSDAQLQPQQSVDAAPWVLVGSEDGCVYVYGLNSQKVLQVVGKGEDGTGQAHADAVLAVDMHPQQPMVVSCGHQRDSSVKVWEHQPQVAAKMEH